MRASAKREPAPEPEPDTLICTECGSVILTSTAAQEFHLRRCKREIELGRRKRLVREEGRTL